MGMSVEARLCWGIPYTNDELEELGEEFCSEIGDKQWDMHRQRLNAVLPEPAGKDYSSPEWEEWIEKRNAWELTQPDLRFRGHTDSEEPDPFLYMKASYKSAEWSEVLQIDASTLTVDPAWEPTLKEYCEALGLPWKQPGWFITAYYG